MAADDADCRDHAGRHQCLQVRLARKQGVTPSHWGFPTPGTPHKTTDAAGNFVVAPTMEVTLCVGTPINATDRRALRIHKRHCSLTDDRVYAFVNKRYMARQLEASAHTSTVAEESFGSLRTVRSFAQEGTQCARYAAACADVERWGLKSAAAGGVFTGGAFLVSAFSLVCILWFGAHRVINGAMTLGQLNTFALYAIFVATEAGESLRRTNAASARGASPLA